MSNCLQVTPSVRPHFLREQILPQDYFSFCREDTSIWIFSIALSGWCCIPCQEGVFTAKRPLLNVLAHSASRRRGGWGSPQCQLLSEEAPWGGISASWHLGWLSALVCLSQRNYVNENQTHCHWKGSFRLVSGFPETQFHRFWWHPCFFLSWQYT